MLLIACKHLFRMGRNTSCEAVPIDRNQSDQKNMTRRSRIS